MWSKKSKADSFSSKIIYLVVILVAVVFIFKFKNETTTSKYLPSSNSKYANVFDPWVTKKIGSMSLSLPRSATTRPDSRLQREIDYYGIDISYESDTDVYFKTDISEEQLKEKRLDSIDIYDTGFSIYVINDLSANEFKEKFEAAVASCYLKNKDYNYRTYEQEDEFANSMNLFSTFNKRSVLYYRPSQCASEDGPGTYGIYLVNIEDKLIGIQGNHGPYSDAVLKKVINSIEID